MVCFFQDAAKFMARYATFESSFALTAVTPGVEESIGALVKRAVG